MFSSVATDFGSWTNKKRSVEITIHFGLDNIIKLKFTNFYRCAILNVLNCLTKNFEPLFYRLFAWVSVAKWFPRWPINPKNMGSRPSKCICFFL